MSTKPSVPFAALAFGVLGLVTTTVACDESKYDKYKSAPEAAASAASSAATAALASAAASAAPSAAASATWQKKSPADCKPHPASVDFDDAPLENEARRKLGKDGGPAHASGSRADQVDQPLDRTPSSD